MLLLAAAACQRAAPAALPEEVARLDLCLLAQPVRPDGDWLLFGRFELTLVEYQPEVLHVDGELPATGLALADCEAWCTPRGLRLPSPEEWLALASGAAPRPAGAGTERSDLTLGLGRPLPVGVFERGRLANGAYDVFGNVWERLDGEIDGMTLAAGGSYATRAVAVDAFLELAPADRLEDVGMRYAADATTYLLERVVPLWMELDRRDRQRCAAVFSRWRGDLRRSFADHLEARGAPADFCDQVRG